MYARIGLQVSTLSRVERLLFKPFWEPTIVLGETTYRFVSASAGNSLLLRLPPTSEISRTPAG